MILFIIIVNITTTTATTTATSSSNIIIEKHNIALRGWESAYSAAGARSSRSHKTGCSCPEESTVRQPQKAEIDWTPSTRLQAYANFWKPVSLV